MRDWNTLVKQRLGKLKLPEAQREEVAAELAAHLQDLEDAGGEYGIRESVATPANLYEATDWSGLTRKIQKAKREDFPMNSRSKSFWLPALVTFFAVQVCWAILVRTSFYANISSTPFRPMFLLLGALPVFGALGAYLSRRGGGNRVARMAVGLFPAVAMFCLMTVLFFLGLMVDRQTVAARWAHIWLAIVIGVATSGAALLLGTFPFLKNGAVTASES
jgi:hypothetical protein